MPQGVEPDLVPVAGDVVVEPASLDGSGEGAVVGPPLGFSVTVLICANEYNLKLFISETSAGRIMVADSPPIRMLYSQKDSST